jgi:hypothetical protein
MAVSVLPRNAEIDLAVGRRRDLINKNYESRATSRVSQFS